MRSASREHSIFQGAALTIVLCGLLFSSGEGIQLLPFPAVERSAHGSTNLEAGVEADYQENITRFEKRQSVFGFQKHNKNSAADSTGSTRSELNYTPATISIDAADVYEEGFILAGRVFVSDLNCRPPPYA